MILGTKTNTRIDRSSKRSSPGDGLSTLYRLTRIQTFTLIYMGDLHLVLPAMILSTLDSGILIMVQQVRLMMFSLNMLDYSMSFLSLST